MFQNESDVFSKVLGIAKYVLKLNQIEINKLPAELNAAYEKYEVPEKVNQAKSYLETQVTSIFICLHDSIHCSILSVIIVIFHVYCILYSLTREYLTISIV